MALGVSAISRYQVTKCNYTPNSSGFTSHKFEAVEISPSFFCKQTNSFSVIEKKYYGWERDALSRSQLLGFSVADQPVKEFRVYLAPIIPDRIRTVLKHLVDNGFNKIMNGTTMTGIIEYINNGEKTYIVGFSGLGKRLSNGQLKPTKSGCELLKKIEKYTKEFVDQNNIEYNIKLAPFDYFKDVYTRYNSYYEQNEYLLSDAIKDIPGLVDKICLRLWTSYERIERSVNKETMTIEEIVTALDNTIFTHHDANNKMCIAQEYKRFLDGNITKKDFIEYQRKVLKIFFDPDSHLKEINGKIINVLYCLELFLSSEDVQKIGRAFGSIFKNVYVEPIAFNKDDPTLLDTIKAFDDGNKVMFDDIMGFLNKALDTIKNKFGKDSLYTERFKLITKCANDILVGLVTAMGHQFFGYGIADYVAQCAEDNLLAYIDSHPDVKRELNEAKRINFWAVNYSSKDGVEKYQPSDLCECCQLHFELNLNKVLKRTGVQSNSA